MAPNRSCALSISSEESAPDHYTGNMYMAQRGGDGRQVHSTCCKQGPNLCESRVVAATLPARRVGPGALPHERTAPCATMGGGLCHGPARRVRGNVSAPGEEFLP